MHAMPLSFPTYPATHVVEQNDDAERVVHRAPSYDRPLEGEVQHFSQDGQLVARTCYRNGQRHGEMQHFDADG